MPETNIHDHRSVSRAPTSTARTNSALSMMQRARGGSTYVPARVPAQASPYGTDHSTYSSGPVYVPSQMMEPTAPPNVDAFVNATTATQQGTIPTREQVDYALKLAAGVLSSASAQDPYALYYMQYAQEQADAGYPPAQTAVEAFRTMAPVVPHRGRLNQAYYRDEYDSGPSAYDLRQQAYYDDVFEQAERNRDEEEWG